MKFKRIAAGLLSGVSLFGGIVGGAVMNNSVAYAANSDIVSITDRNGNKVDVDNGFTFDVFSEKTMNLKVAQSQESEKKEVELTLSYCYDASKDNIYISFLRPSDGAEYGKIKIDNLYYGHLLGERSFKLNIPEFGTVNMIVNDSGFFDYEAILSIKFNDGTVINLPGMTKDGISYYTTTIPFMKDRTSVRYVSDDGEDFTIRYSDFGLDKYMSSGKNFTIQGKQHKYKFYASCYGSPDQFTYKIYLEAVDDMRVKSTASFDSDNPQDLNFKCNIKEDVSNLPDSKVWVTCSKTPELADSNNLYNFLYDTKELDLNKNEKWTLDFSKVGDTIPLEKR